MPVALHGNLRDFGIGEVFQLIGQQRKTGVLEVGAAARQVELRFDAGRIVSAAPVGAHEHTGLGEMLVRCGLLTRERLGELEHERQVSLRALPDLILDHGLIPLEEIQQIEGLLTRETILDLLRWTEGSFRFVAQPVRHERPPEELLGAEQVLMDGLRMVDEWRTLSDDVPSESVVFRRVGSFESYRIAQGNRDPRQLAAEERVFLLVDGRLPARRVIDLSRLGTFDGMRILAELRRGGLIEPTQAPKSGRTVRGAGSMVFERDRIRRALATALGLGLLVVLCALTYRSAPAGDAGPGLRLERHPLAAARTAFATLRMRRLFEADRVATGNSPSTLAELRRFASRGGALTPSEASPYYYDPTFESGALLLAPER